MFSELPKLFDRDFAIGYFLPMACFFGASYVLLTLFHHVESVQSIVTVKEGSPLVSTTLLGILVWLAAVLLLLFNRLLYQLFEGYWWPSTTRMAKFMEKDALDCLENAIDKAYNSKALSNKLLTPEKQKESKIEETQKRAELLRERAEAFPERKRDVLSSKFGNAIRAFETYPGAMYGIDSIEGWPRLLAVIPRDYLQIIESAKAETDFWLNMWFLSWLIVFAYLIFSFTAKDFSLNWYLDIVLIFIMLCRYAAIRAAKEWGALFRAAFDVFLPILYEKLQLKSNDGNEDQRSTDRDVWGEFSKAITYRQSKLLPPRKLVRDAEFEQHNEPDEASEVEGNGNSSDSDDESQGNDEV